MIASAHPLTLLDQGPGRYDVIVAGARVAGASTALLLARAGLDVLVVDPTARGRDTLSTHALMRGGVLQLARWGLLDRIRAAGTPRIEATTFHYGDDRIEVPVRADDRVDGLYAPRRTVLDSVIVDAAREAGATFLFGASVQALATDPDGRVRGAVVGSGRATRTIHAELVVGADGRNSRIARMVRAPVTRSIAHATASIYGYWPGLDRHAYHWYYREGMALGTIPTNDGLACVFASVTPDRLRATPGAGLADLHADVARVVAPEVAGRLAGRPATGRIRGFAGAPGVLRRPHGPGWALVGDAGYFKDPLTAHGITDALRDAELLAAAVLDGTAEGFAGYEATRDRMSRSLLELTGAVAAMTWSLDEIRALHLELSRVMKSEVREMGTWAVPEREGVATWAC